MLCFLHRGFWWKSGAVWASASNGDLLHGDATGCAAFCTPGHEAAAHSAVNLMQAPRDFFGKDPGNLIANAQKGKALSFCVRTLQTCSWRT